jgi:SAM-dependent methyltransferase
VRIGMVEQFNPPWVEGWIAVPPGTPPVPVRLRVNDSDIVTSMVADPAKRRVPGSEVRKFRFVVNGLWKYLTTDDRVRVMVGDQPLPIVGHGTYYRPEKDGPLRLSDLLAKLDQGYVFSRTGWLQLSKKLDLDWQEFTLLQASNVCTFVSERFGVDAFFIYGTLLGAVREGGPIGHDSDLDLGYLSQYSDGPRAAQELRDIAFGLIEAGFRVLAYRTHLRIANDIDGHKDVHVDLFHTYFDETGILRFPYGVAGVGDVHKSDWKGVRETDFAGGRGLLPVCAEKIAQTLYGAGWRQPQPGFSWDRDRKTRATDALMPQEMIEEIYWADFYEHTEFSTGSTFFDAVDARADAPHTVVDIGCGDGRDSFAHAKAGRRVFGLDRSHIGIRHAAAKADELGLQDSLTFRVCDVGEAAAMSEVLDEVRAAAGGEPVLFYLRFFLHSIPEEVQDALLAAIAVKSRPGDLFAAEFRTDLDKDSKKIHANHFRRFQNGPAFGARLAEKYGFEVLVEQEGTGLSPYRGEDPHLYRLTARR